jgi:hypothetical protein
VPCTSPERGIVLVPSCGQVSGDVCVAPDAGVFKVSPTASGKVGTACAGMAFSTAVVDPAFGMVRFTPQPAAARVTLPNLGAKCEIAFTFSVLKAPSLDSSGAPGVQTAQTTEHRQYVGLLGPAALNAQVRASTAGTTVITPPPPPLPDFALFSTSPTTLRVSTTGRFTFSFVSSPGRKGKARLESTKAVKVFKKKRKLKVAAKAFKAPTSGKVNVKFKLSSTNLKVLRKRTSLQFTVTVRVGTTDFTAKLKLKPPKKKT